MRPLEVAALDESPGFNLCRLAQLQRRELIHALADDSELRQIIKSEPSAARPPGCPKNRDPLSNPRPRFKDRDRAFWVLLCRLWAIDFLTVPTLTFGTLCVLVVLSPDRRHIVHINLTTHPTAEWTAPQLGLFALGCNCRRRRHSIQWIQRSVRRLSS